MKWVSAGRKIYTSLFSEVDTGASVIVIIVVFETLQNADNQQGKAKGPARSES
jgi:hypothetical protein